MISVMEADVSEPLVPVRWGIGSVDTLDTRGRHRKNK